MEKKVTKAALMEYLRKMLTSNETWAQAALLRIYDNQTSSEQAGEDTHNLNGIGFTVGDARLLTRFAEWYKTHGWLSPKQMKWVFVKMDYFSWEKLETAYIRANG